MLNDKEIAELLSAVEVIAMRAADAILQIYNTEGKISVDLKSDQSPLTDADRASHQTILAGLSELRPSFPVLSEESSAESIVHRRSWPTFFCVDPLDGTKEFIKRNGEFTVNIALIHEGLPVCGVVYIPVREEGYAGITGQGACRFTRTGLRQPIQTRPLKKHEPVTIVASRSHHDEHLDNLIRRLEKHFGAVDLLSMGSSLKFCLLAEGKADLYPRLAPTSEWDTAAAHAVVLAAGGEVVGPDFRSLRYNQRATLLNPHFCAMADTTVNWSELLPFPLP